MDVILNDTGELIRLAPSEQFKKALKTFREKDCVEHIKTEWRSQLIAGGTLQVRSQCLICGGIVGNARKRTPGDEQLPKVDKTIAQQYSLQRQQEYDGILQTFAKQQRDREAEWFKKYNEYTLSPAWKAKRVLVFKRSAGICEGCGVRPATEVHHRHYNQLGNEFLFDLIALCGGCHSRLHEPMIISKPLSNAAVESSGLIDIDDFGPCAGCRFAIGSGDVCGLTGESSLSELSARGVCGPTKQNFQPLK